MMEESTDAVDGGRTIAPFIDAVNAVLTKLGEGFRVGDLILFPTYNEWVSGSTPEETARKAVEYAGSDEYRREREAYAAGMGITDDEVEE